MKRFLTPLFLFATLFIAIPQTQAVFTDVTSDHPYFEAINTLQENGIVQGYEDGSFQPNKYVNRAEALKIILLGSDILVPEIQQQAIFPDVSYDTWYAKYVAKAKNLNIVSGDGDTGFFRPGDTINLAEILKILLNTNNRTLSQPDESPYADVPVDSWFSPYFAYAESISMLSQNSSEPVYPATPVTRGLMAELMVQLIQKPDGYQEGEASYYGEKFHGKGTASGEVFDASGFTAAHRTLPFNTWLEVRNLENNETVNVRVNDRGPYAGDRIIDLSKAAFEAISPLSRGVITVAVKPIDAPEAAPQPGDPSPDEEEVIESGELTITAPADCETASEFSLASPTQFENITLSSPLPNQLIEDEILILSGTTASSQDTVSAFVIDENDQQSAFYADNLDGEFSLNVSFPTAGTYRVGILPGRSGASTVYEIAVLPTTCVPQTQDLSLPAAESIDFSIKQGDLTIDWPALETAGTHYSKLIFTQGSQKITYLLKNKTSFTPYYPDFRSFQPGSVKLTLQQTALNQDHLVKSENIVWNSPASAFFTAETHQEFIYKADRAPLNEWTAQLQSGQALEFSFEARVDVQSDAKIIRADGQVDTIALSHATVSPSENSNGIMVYPASTSDLILQYTPDTAKTHFFEVNDDQGLAVINAPVYPEGSYPLLPNPVELANLQARALTDSLDDIRNQMLSLVNADRAAHGLNALTLDNNLNQLGQYRSEDMTRNDYFSHWDPEGNTANDIKKDFAISQFVAENIARDITPELAQYGLMRSASHRANILKPEWKRVGFGISDAGQNGTIFVQIFSEAPLDFNNPAILRNKITDAINEQRSSPLGQSSSLHSHAQSWTDAMVAEDFFDFINPEGTSLVDSLRDQGVNATLGTYIVGNSSFDGAIDQIVENEQIMDLRWKQLGVGIKQDSFGIIKVTLIYTE
jgi:rare lipoprotein A (peptidoglycan hydrolase)/uncharacterized protein YkwD